MLAYAHQPELHCKSPPSCKDNGCLHRADTSVQLCWYGFTTTRTCTLSEWIKDMLYGYMVQCTNNVCLLLMKKRSACMHVHSLPAHTDIPGWHH